MQRLHIDAKDDLVLRLAHRDQPVAGVIELIWNSLDAEAHNVNVVLERNGLDAVERVRVEDDGHGIPPERIPAAFGGLGGSWKAAARVSPNLKRRMNGSNGQGRIRGFALGSSVSWTTTAVDTAGVLRRTTVTGRASDPTNFDASESPVVGEEPTGTVFVAEDPATYVNRVTTDSARPRITATFALFLTSNPDVTVTFDGVVVDPSAAERHRADYTLADYATADQQAPVLRIIEWGNDPGRAIHLCDTTGSVLQTISPDIHTPGYHYTAYVMWEEFSKRSQDLLLAELQAGEFGDVIAAVRESIKQHFRGRDSERRAEQIRQWQADGDYPYSGPPQGEAERAEREAFDYVATSVARKLPKAQIGRRSMLGLLKVAVANEPSAVPEILDQLMPLPKQEQDSLARLLRRTPMSKLIEANTVITNRLDFLAALREMVFDAKVSKRVKERKELHKILERELWIFGEEFALLLSDRGLEEVLNRHLAVLRKEAPKRRKGESGVRRTDRSRGIVDLMLSQQRRGVSRREHLVVELKRPTVIVSQHEVAQIKSYAEAVASDSQFHGIDVHWDFWVISSELEATVIRDASEPHRPPGQLAEWGGNIRIWAKTWSQLIDDNEARLRLFKEALEYDASHEHAADYVNRAHEAEAVPAPLRAVPPQDEPSGDAA